MSAPIYPDADTEAEARGADHLMREELDGPEPEYDLPPEPPRGAADAGWMLRRLGRARKRLAVTKHIAAHERDRIDTWEAGHVEARRREIEWLEDSLAQYHRAVLAEDKAAKTIELPDGTLKARMQQPSWEFDPPTFVTWALGSAPDLLRTVVNTSIDKAAAKKALTLCEGTDGVVDVITADGERVPGVTVQRRDVSFQVVTPEADE